METMQNKLIDVQGFGAVHEVRKDLPLADVEPRRPGILQRLIVLLHLASYVAEERIGCLRDDIQVEVDEVSDVVVVRLRQKVRVVVLPAVALHYLRNGQVLHGRVPVAYHVPVEQGSRYAPVAVHEGMDVSEREVKHYSLHYGVHENAVVVGEVTHPLNQVGDPAEIRRVVIGLAAEHVADRDGVVVPESSFVCLVVEGAVGDDGMYLPD